MKQIRGKNKNSLAPDRPFHIFRAFINILQIAERLVGNAAKFPRAKLPFIYSPKAAGASQSMIGRVRQLASMGNSCVEEKNRWDMQRLGWECFELKMSKFQRKLILI